MNEPIIDREEAVALFHELLDPACEERFLRLVGDAKMGKSHLLTKVFPRIAHQAGATCFVLDLRNSSQTVIDLLHIASNGLKCDPQGAFAKAFAEWSNRPRLQVKGLVAMLAQVSVRSQDEAEEARRIVPHLTKAFVADVRALGAYPVMLIFDAVEQASEATRSWLMDMLLVQLAGVAHVHAVVAGRELPEAAGSYHPICMSYELRPVEEEELYIRYCERAGVLLAAQSIRDFAKAVKYTPGRFIDITEVFAPKGVGRGR